MLSDYSISISRISSSSDGDGTIISGFYQEKKDQDIKYPYSVQLSEIQYNVINVIGTPLIKTLLLNSISHYRETTDDQNLQYIQEFPINLELFIQGQQQTLQEQKGHLFLLKLLHHAHGLQLFKSELRVIDTQQITIVNLDKDFVIAWYDEFLYKYGIMRHQFTEFIYRNKIQSIYYHQLNSEEKNIFNSVKNVYQYSANDTTQLFASTIKNFLFSVIRQEIGFTIIQMAIDNTPINFTIQPDSPQKSYPIPPQNTHDSEEDDWHALAKDLKENNWLQNQQDAGCVIVHDVTTKILFDNLSQELADIEPIYTNVLQIIGSCVHLIIPSFINNIHGIIYNYSEIYFYIKNTEQKLHETMLSISARIEDINGYDYVINITICNEDSLNNKIVILSELDESEYSLLQGNTHVIYDLDQLN